MTLGHFWLAHPTPLLAKARSVEKIDRPATNSPRLLVDNLITIPTNTNGVEAGNP